jgi:DNA-binding GntR family transcriptional regulator
MTAVPQGVPTVGILHQPLRVAVRDEIRRRIIAGSLPQGERIFEDQLAQALGVSRNPVREALQTLAREGFVEMEPRRGARVMVLSDTRATQLFQVREPLEGLVASLAAARRTDAQLRDIDDVIEAGRTALVSGDLSPLPSLNTRFHGLLVETAGNELLTEVLDGLTHVIEWMYTRRVRERGLWSWEEHAAIAACIAAQDGAAAQALACEHIRNARDAYFSAPAEA